MSQQVLDVNFFKEKLQICDIGNLILFVKNIVKLK